MPEGGAPGGGGVPAAGGQLDAIAGMIPHAILCLDRAWRITYMNAEAMRLGRLTEESYRQGTFWEHYADLVGSELEGQYCRVMETGEPLHTVYFYERFGMWVDLHAMATKEGVSLYFRNVTVLKEAQAAREAMQRQLQQVLETTTDCVCALDRGWTFTYLNLRAEALLGRTDLIGKNIWEEYPAAADTDYYRYFHRAMDEGEAGEFDAFYPDVLNVWVRMICRPTEDGIVIFFRDITQERSHSEIMERQYALLADTQKVARVATWEVDLRTGVLIHSPASYPVYGRPLETLKTMEDLKACVSGPHGQRIDEAVTLAMRSRASVTVEFGVLTMEGEPIWLESRLRMVENEGQPAHLHGLTIDITARKRADERREAAIRQLDRVMEATSEGVMTLDRSWRISYMNPRAQAMMAPPGDYTGQNSWEVFPEGHGMGLEQPFRDAMERGKAAKFESFYPAPYNRWFAVDVLPSEEGIVMFFRDVTVEKQAKQQLEDQHALLASIQRDARMATWEIDLMTDQVSFQPGSYPVFGRPNEELTTLAKWRACVVEPDAETFTRRVQEGILGGKTTRHEWKMRGADGSDVWVESRAKAVFEGGAAVRLRGITVDITAEHEAREQLAEERRTLEYVQQTARVATWEHDLATDRVKYTSGSYPVYGRPFEEIVDLEGFLKLVHPEDRRRIIRSTEKAIATGQTMVNEFRAITPDGTTVWLEERFRAVEEEGKTVSLRGMTIDIGKRKRDEEALRQSEERYRVLAELNPQALWMGSADGRITYANQGFLDYIGMALEELENWLDAFDPADRPSVLAAWTRSVRTGENYDVEARILRESDGASRWWWLRAQPVRDANGAVLNWLGVAMDIHDRRTFADALLLKQEETERQRAELETVYATAPIGLALFDPKEFRYLQLNDQQAEIVGLPKDQVLGRTATEIAPIPGLREMFEQVAQGRPVANQMLEGELPTQPGVHRYWTVNYFPVYDVDGKIQAISAASLEITPQKRAENALIQSEKLAAVGRLATSISHEINNPLEAITNLLYLIAAEKDLPEETRLYLSMAQAELARVCQIATQTLRFHRQSVGPTMVSAKDLVGAVLNLYQGRLANSGVQVETKFASERRILCFENDIRQVLNNLIANAIDAMRTGGRLVVRTHNSVAFAPGEATPRHGILITVADTGHGMTPEVMSRIFEAFYTTKDLNGTGLGMWITEGIVRRHHGVLKLRSSTDEVAHGTIITLFLPAQEAIERAR